jgi:Cu(I)/Ag(I) efflux system periplasmic protein CusF
MMQRIAAALLALAFGSALAQSTLTEAEVRKVDPAHGKITLRHGEIKNLDMPPMTMVFTAKDKALLKNVKAGDKVRFAADKDAAGEYIVTAIEPAK